MRRRQVVWAPLAAAVASGLPACRPAPDRPLLAHVQGGWAGPDVTRGHALREPPASWSEGRSVPDRVRRVHVLVVGGGVAGLAAARGLVQRGVDDFALLELEDETGGNARGLEVQGQSCPMGAHYLPVPGHDNPDLQHLLADLGLLQRDAAGRWRPDERHLCHSPQERVWHGGQWNPGLLPLEQAGARTLDQVRRFAQAVAQAQQQARAQGMPHLVPFGVLMQKRPLALHHQGLDALVFGAWLKRQGLDDPQLLAHLDYCCRDDHGAGLDTVSAWAGVHYFAGRHGFAAPGAEPGPGAEAVFTWPEGNAWLTRRMAQPLLSRLHTAQVVHRVTVQRAEVVVDARDARTGQHTRWLARRCVVALPVHVAARVVAGTGPGTTEVLRAAARRLPSAPWVVTHLHLSQPLIDRGGAAPAWDNVVPHSTGLGYVNAGHQRLEPVPTGPQVLSHYRALGGVPAARTTLLQLPWQHWVQAAVDELHEAHPELPGLLTHARVVRHGHGMAVSVPGVLNEIARWRNAVGPDQLLKQERLAFAHSDWSACPVFEEAFALGLAAGRACAT